MKVLFVAFLKSEGASGNQRLWALKQCGLEVYSIDKDNYKTIFGNLSGKIAKVFKRPKFASDTKKLQHDVINACVKIQPDVIWLEWAREFQPSTLKQIKKLLPKATLISMQDDNPWGDRKSDKWMWKDYFKVIPEFDIHIIKRKSDAVHLKSMGGKKTIFWEHGMYAPVFYPSADRVNKKYPVSFVGTCMDQRVQLITHLLESGIPIHVFGTRWDTRSNLPKRFPGQFHGPVEGEAYADVIRQSLICLGLVSHSNHDEWTMRTYEVPACGGLLLAERTPTHERLFTEDTNAVFFSNAEDCTNKLLDLLRSPEKCEEMGQAAYASFITNKYTIESRMQDLIQQIKAYRVEHAG